MFFAKRKEAVFRPQSLELLSQALDKFYDSVNNQHRDNQISKDHQDDSSKSKNHTDDQEYDHA